MPPPARTRASASIELVGGLAEKPSAIAKFRDGRLTDVEVVAADGTAFHAHALCITSGSEYFERLLAGERWADTAGRPLSLPEVPKQGLAACLEFIYTGSCALADEAELIVVLEAAAYLQIPHLVDAAAKAMSAHLSATTALAFWAVADRQGLSQLAADAVSAAARHFEQIAATPAWLSAPAEMVRVLLASDRLKVADEEAAYSAAVKWLHAQAPPPAEDDALALLRLVRFPLLRREFVQETVHNEPLLLTVAGMQVLSRSLLGALHGDSARRRIDFEKLYMVGGTEFRDDMATYRYDSMANVWEAMAPPLSTARDASAASASVDGKLYVMGGYGGVDGRRNRLSSVERYDPAKNAWEAVAPMSTPRSFPAAAEVDGKLYVMGGHDGNYPTNLVSSSSVERYDPAKNAWEAVAPMSTARFSPAATVFDGKLYVMGGSGQLGWALSSVERYDPAKNAWEAVAPMSTARYTSAAAVFDGKLYVMGGYAGPEGLSSVERYDPVKNAWEAVAPMSTARDCLAAAVFDGKLYVMGGAFHDERDDDDGEPLSSVERYDPARNAWEAIASMALDKNTISLCAVSI